MSIITFKNEYWNSFYQSAVNKININHPSQFAVFTVGEARGINTILEFGCGNGRDAFFFSNYFKKIYAFDSSEEIINKNIKQYSKINNLKFLKYDLNNNFVKKNVLLTEKKAIYARFFIHALTDDEIRLFISLCAKLLKKNECLYLEYRTEKDKKGKKVTKNHYRNYIKKRFLNNLLNDFNLESIYFVMGLGYAKFKDDDAFVARHIIVKK
jgi:SAM-dependent methyltransferase